MDFFEVMKERHSIRAFASKPVEQDKLQKILETTNAAPSAGNLQAYEIYVVRQSQHRAALARASAQRFVADAPVVLVFCTHAARSARHYGQRGTRLYTVQDATVACTFAMLAVTALGLATVWVGAFDDEAVRQAIEAPESVIPVAILPIGYAAETPEKTTRRRLDKLVHQV
jgi:nitroreductase